MQKKLAKLDQIIPAPESIEAEAPDFQPGKRSTIEEAALRRAKVKELMKMGYGANQIAIILSRGIKIKGGGRIKVPVNEKIIERDIAYIRQEAAAEDVDFREKRADIIEKLRFLYNQAIREYMDAKGAVRNSFLNTALAVLNKVMDIEGVKAPENIRESLSDESRIEGFALEIQKLSKDAQHTIITAVRKVARGGGAPATKKSGVSSKSPGVSAQPGDNERVPGKS